MTSRILLRVVLVPALVGLATLGGEATATAAAKYPRMHAALHELKETRVELKEAAHDFGGHREKALKATDVAIHQMEKALEAAGDKYQAGSGPGKEAYKKYEHHPHIHHAIHTLKEARGELKEAAHDFGGHREKALRDVDHAIEQLELALKFARK